MDADESPPGTLLGFIESLPETVREGVAAGVVAMFDASALDPERSSVDWLRAYLAAPALQQANRSILVCAGLDHVLSIDLPDRSMLAEALGPDPSHAARDLIAGAPMRADHRARASAMWGLLRRTALAPEALRRYALQAVSG